MTIIAPEFIVVLGDTTPPRAMLIRTRFITVVGVTVPSKPEEGSLIELENGQTYQVIDRLDTIVEQLRGGGG